MIWRELEGQPGREIRQITEEVLPCPFCAGRALLFHRKRLTASVRFYILCVSCRGRGGTDGSEPEALRRWNLRPPAQGRKLGGRT